MATPQIDGVGSGTGGGRVARAPSLAGVVGLAFGVLGLRLAMAPLRDNSFLTHLATGRLILDTGGIPRHDPFSFSAPGQEWTVQSWLAATLFGALDELGGGHAIQLAIGITGALLTALAWALTRPARSLVVRMGLLCLVLLMAVREWSERPFLFGLVFLALTLLVAERRLHPAWLVPVYALWVNVHGSFPLGLLALAVLAAGSWADSRPRPGGGGAGGPGGGGPGVELRALRFALLGAVLGAVNPLGPKLLVFPLQLLGDRDKLDSILEWQAPRFVEFSERAFLVLVLVAVIALVRQPTWRAALPVLVFVPAALLSARNITVATLILLPGAAAGFRGLGSLDGAERRAVHRPAAAALVGLAVVVVATQLAGPAYDLDAYPNRPVRWLQEARLVPGDERLVTQDFVGNYLEGLYGTRQRVFMDDRYDMFPLPVIDDYRTLLFGTAAWADALDRAAADVVLWQRDLPLAQLLEESSAWEIAYRDDDWIIACPTRRPCR